MSKRKQSFDQLLPDPSCSSDSAEPLSEAEPEETSELGDQRERPEKRMARTYSDLLESEDEKEEDILSKSMMSIDQPSDESKTEDDRKGEAPGLIFYSIEELIRLQNKGKPREETAEATEDFTEEQPASTSAGRRKSYPELIEFVGASYRKADADSTDSVDYVCKNKKLTRRNKRACEGLIKFRMSTKGDAFQADTDDLTEYTPHDDWCEYLNTNDRLRDLRRRSANLNRSQPDRTSSLIGGRPEESRDQPGDVRPDDDDPAKQTSELVALDSLAEKDDSEIIEPKDSTR